ncbi:BgtAc-30814 [Blumeria graminis f. sp. tritici]|uniref:BgtAc-30814 n=2 Tax=Blumeria graminis f. sp. tritici TaxID=62690 RepID=A0A9X9LAG1_BLUGR|nr:hypothetical protein BGT96224_Ac30814 [Blumeria graminis f. sp. tritici 96224]VCU40264.1 BgtAc-30814 [Blumeria graminis f. sp. tritici]
MDQFEEFSEYTTRNPAYQILAFYTWCLSLQPRPLRGELRNYLMVYLRSTDNHANINFETNIRDSQFKISKEEVPTHEFERSIYLFKSGSDRDIWYYTLHVADLLTRGAAPILPELQIPLTQKITSTSIILLRISESYAYDHTKSGLEETF